MSHRAPGGGAAQRMKTAATSVLAWHDARPRASFDTARGWWWAALVAALFIWMSNPLLFIPGFYLSLDQALYWTEVVAVISLPWLRLPRVPWPWLAFLGLCVLSQLWTIDDVHTDLSIAVYAKVTALAVVVAANCEADVVCVGLAVGGMVTTGLSLYTYRLDVPGASYLAMGEDGVVDRVLAGIGTNENILAYTLVVSLAATLALGHTARRGARAAWWGALGVQAYGLYLANSGTGYQTAVALLLVMAGLAAGPRLTPVRSHRVLMGAVVSLSLLLVVSLVGVSALLGKQLTTFSGRADFWRATIASTLDRAPVLGSGWGAVWEHPWDPKPQNEVALDIYTRAGYALSHGHNFFVDVLPELGLLGVAVALLMVVYAIRQVRRCGLYAGAPDPLVGRVVLLVLVALLASGVTEPMLTVPLGWWSLALVVAMSRQRVVPRSPRGTRVRRAAAPQRPVSVPAEVMS